MITREQAEAYAKCSDCNTCAVKKDCAARLGTEDRRYFGTEILALIDDGPGVWKDAPESADKAIITWRDKNGTCVVSGEVYTRTPTKTSERIAAEEKAARMVGKTAEEIADILMEEVE